MEEINREKFMDDLLRKRIIYLDGDVTDDMAKRIGSSVLWLNAEDDTSEIILYINSSGGKVAAGLHLYDIVKHSKAPVTGIIYRIANSMAAIVLQACKKRKALRHSEIILHNIQLTVSTEWHKIKEEVDREVKETKKDQEAIYAILTERMGKTKAEIIKILEESKKLGTEEAKEFGLIDEII